jgi:putative membrane-bound dehydrogenase-like protein
MPSRRSILFPLLALSALVGTIAPCLGGALKNAGPLSPRDEQATFRLPKGFRVELVACEPEVVDPVAFAFDEEGRLFVAEMRGYPNGGVATGKVTSGRIRLLEDRDGDGFYERSTIFADGLRLPSGVMPYKGGLLVANPPELIYLEDTDGDGKADKKTVLYTGFDLSNSEQLLNSLQWGLDNWVHACAGGAGGTIRSAQKADAPRVTLRGRGIRFHPDVPASLEPTSGGGQYGLAMTEWGQWLTATNSQHLRHIVLPDHYLRRNPLLPVSAVTLDIPDHGAACKVHRLSPFEAWRVERTRRRKQGEGGFNPRSFPANELVPGGYITSGCSPAVYLADLFPRDYHGSSFVCDPANNIIHRDLLEEHGATFTAKRGEADCEFLASTDNWFRPVWLAVGPDGALYVADFYREVIETPLSLPDDIKQKVNLESRGRGRIWRIVPEGKRAARRPALRKAPTAELVKYLADPNVWWRHTCQRLLTERQDKLAVPALRRLAREATLDVGRAHCLWTLDGLHALKDEEIERGLRDPMAGVREQALRLAESRLTRSEHLRKAVAALADDPSPRVRFQLAFTAGEADAPETAAAVARLARRQDNDSWTRTALLSSAYRLAPALLEALSRDRKLTQAPAVADRDFVTRLAALVGARPDDEAVARALALLTEGPKEPMQWRLAVLEGLGQGLQTGRGSLTRLWESPPPKLKTALERTRPLFAGAAATARDDKRPLADRTAAVRLLSYGPFPTVSPSLQQLLAPRNPQELQLAAVRALSLHEGARVADLLLSQWGGYSPVLRREVLVALFAQKPRLQQLLDAVERKQVLAGQLEPARLAMLRQHPDAAVRQRALKLLAGQVAPARQKVVESYRPALDLKAEPARGKVVFQKNCATCHRLENVGVEVGPDLLSALRTKTPEALLVDILDPSREVDPRFIEYVVTTTDGRVSTGMIAAETASSVTLRRAEKVEDAILRGQIDTIQATARSLMPDGLEMQLNRQDLADVIAYLQAVAAKK